MASPTGWSQGLSHVEELSQIATGAGLYFGGQFIGAGMLYLTYVLIGRSFGPEAFGIYALGFAVYKLLSTLATFGTDDGLFRFLAIHRSVGDTSRIETTYRFARRRGLVCSMLIASLLFLFSPIIAVSIFNEENLIPVLRLFALALPLFTMINQTSFACRALGRIDFAVIVKELVYPATNMFGVALIILLGFSVSAAVAAHGVAALGAAALGLFLFRRAFPRLKGHRLSLPDQNERRGFLLFSGLVALTGLLSVLTNWTDTLILAYFRPAAEVGVYSAAARTSSLLNYFVIAFGAIFGPIIATLSHSGEKEKLAHMYRIVSRWSLLSGGAVCFAFVLFSKDILETFGRGFGASSHVLVVLSLAQLMNLATGLSGYFLIMSGKEKAALVSQGLGVAVNLIFNLAFIPLWGMIGAALATALSLVGVNIVRLLLIYRLYDLRPVDLSFLKPFVAGGVGAVVVYFLDGYGEWYYRAAMFAAVYVATFFLLGASEEERVVVRDAAGRLTKYASLHRFSL